MCENTDQNNSECKHFSRSVEINKNDNTFFQFTGFTYSTFLHPLEKEGSLYNLYILGQDNCTDHFGIFYIKWKKKIFELPKQIFREVNSANHLRTIILNYQGRAYIDKYYIGKRRAPGLPLPLENLLQKRLSVKYVFRLFSTMYR